MIDVDVATSTDITDLILIEHDEFRDRFRQLWDMLSHEDDAAWGLAWRVLADLLEMHAKAEEEILHPFLLQRGSDHVPAETTHAMGEHGQIRDAMTSAARSASGTAFWWASVQACRNANDEHLAEEERVVIPDFRQHTDSGLRCELGARWITFHAEHRAARSISADDVDPAAYVRENS